MHFNPQRCHTILVFNERYLYTLLSAWRLSKYHNGVIELPISKIPECLIMQLLQVPFVQDRKCNSAFNTIV